MPLNLNTVDGDFIPYIKYNAKAGRFYVRPQGAAQDAEVMFPRLAFDMENIKTGWLYYTEGSGPEKVWDPSRTQMAPRPPGPHKFKRGFEVMVFGADDLPGIGKLGLREFSSTANNVIAAILKMYGEYEAGAPKHPGAVPFYKCVKVHPVAGAYGTNYEPEFALINWVDRVKIPAFDEFLEREGIAASNAMPGDFNAPLSNGASHSERNPPPPLDDEIPF